MGSRCGQAGSCKGGEVDVRESEDDGGTCSGAGGPSSSEAAAAEELVPTRQARLPLEAQQGGALFAEEEEEEEEEDEDDDEDDDVSSTEQVWAAYVEIDRGFPFDFVWPGMKIGIFRALRAVGTTWPSTGWQNEADLATSLRRAVEAEGTGPVARGLERSQAVRIVDHLRGELPCSVRVDREGAAAAAAISQAAGPQQDDGPRRERFRRQLRELRERTIHDEGGPLTGMSLLHHIERDLEDDERWRSRAFTMAHALDRLQTLGPDFVDPFSRVLSLASMGRRITITVRREELLTSAIGQVLSAAPHDLCPGRLSVKYHGEEGEDGDGGGGVTRAFLTHSGELLARPHLGLLLPSHDGQVLLSPLPGFLAPGGQGPEGVWEQPERWCRFLGRMLGMSTMHECPLGMLLAPSFCRQLLDQEPCFEDLRFAPGLSSGSSGWFNTLRVLLAHRAPDILREDPTLPRLDDAELDKALLGLDAVMPSRAQQVFEALADYAGRAAHSPQQWVGALDLAAALLAEAQTSTQRKLAMCRAKELIDGVLAGGRELPADMPRALEALRAAIQAASALQAPGAGGPDAGGDACNCDVQALPARKEAAEEPRRWADGPSSQFSSWRGLMARGPGRVLGAWRDATHRRRSPSRAAPAAALPSAPSAPEAAAAASSSSSLAAPPPPLLQRQLGSAAAGEGTAGGEAQPQAPPQQPQPRQRPSLERSLSSVAGQGFARGEELSSTNLHAFAKAVAAKALSENLKPHMDVVVEEFKRVVSSRVRGGFTWQQLQARIAGQRLDPVSFVQAWRDKTTYHACTEEHESVKLWWSFVSEHGPEDLLRLFAWCTGFAAIPATAWKFRINVIDDVSRCPTVNTCMTDDASAANRGVKMPTLYLPAYSSKAVLAKKMEWAVAGASGIHLH